MRRLAAILLFLVGSSAAGQDVLTIGSAAATPGGVVQIPLSIRDRSGTPLGVGAAVSSRIDGFAFKVKFRSELVSSVTFARAGVTASAAALYETAMQGSGWASAVVSLAEAIPLTADAAAPGNLVGMLTVTLTPQAASGTVVSVAFDPPGAVLSNRTGSVTESVAAGTLALVNGTITVSTSAAPSGLVALAAGTSQVGLTWTAAPGAAQYEVWRATGGAPLTLLATAPGASYTDQAVSAGVSYLYRVRSLSGTGAPSPFSDVDAATLVVFTDDPLVARASVVKAVHMTQLRAAVDALRAAAGLPPLAADGSVAAGSAVTTAQLTAVRNGLAAARSAIGLPALTLTDPTLTPGATRIKAAHVEELRQGTR